jgi:aspartate racemase
MQTIGLIGGMSWESSDLYYRLINQETKRRLGGHHNARSVMVSVDFAEVEELQSAGDWEQLGAMMASAARQAESGGADFIVLCTNTMHKLADETFYRDRLRDGFGIEVLVPPPDARQLVHDVIYGELCHGVVRPESREVYRHIIAELARGGAEAVILGCTEIGLLISPEDSALPVYDTTDLHARAAVDQALTR